jgi:uncharacterized protein YdhG (YjbR/CyaY superfamily)
MLTSDYIAAQPPAARRHLRQIRQAVRAVAPDALETISYGIPAFKQDGRVLVYYAAWRAHCSLYPFTGDIQRSFAKELERYETSKGTIRFPLDRPLPIALVKRLVKARLVEVQKKRRPRRRVTIRRA